MDPVLPMTLRGDNLGQRHHYFNLQVNQLVSDHVLFEDVKALPEQSALDRLFKIDVANKLKNIDYILDNLRDDDMLYVSRALKCKWLLEQRDVINPKYIEENLYPQMVMPAISKMKHWLYINLSDPEICQEFYLYYKHITFDFAIKFLIRCNNECLLKEYPELLTKMTPHYLKIFGERNPKLVEIYFDTLATNSELVKQYLKEEQRFYNSIKCVLKMDPDLYLDIVERYHNVKRFTRLSPAATDYILRNRKNRFMAKSELYVAHLVHIPTVARGLSVEECKETVIRLARATYLNNWFSYKNVEPLVKRVNKETRSAFKKIMFVEKNFGEIVVECPYEFPDSPAIKDTDYGDSHVFNDKTFNLISMCSWGFRAMLKKRKYAKWGNCENMSDKSELQKLFNEFRFVGFEGTLHELKDRIKATSSADRRRDMLLVLVSKSGGRVESVRALLQLAFRLRNEPVHIRAAIVRSLVKRACAWRLPDDVWNTMLEYGVGLGLDGTKAEAECREGLHAVVLRQLLTTGDCTSLICTAFLENFSTLLEYKLTASERANVGIGLQNLLMTVVMKSELQDTAKYLSTLLYILDEYRINIETSPALSAVAALAEQDVYLAKPLLRHLYKARVGRRTLLRYNIEFRHDDAALVNLLRHDLELIDPNWFINLLIQGERQANQFLLKLAVYFNETGGVAEKIRLALQNKIKKDRDLCLVRALIMLSSGANLELMLCSEDTIDGKYNKISAAFRNNMHRARPALDPMVLGWRRAGLKAVGIRAIRCRQVHQTQIIQTLLKEDCKRTIRLALALALRTDCVVDIFTIAVTIRSTVALRAALLYFRCHGDAADLRIWEIVKPFFLNIDLTRCRGLRTILGKVEWVPKVVKPNYCAILYLALNKISDIKAGHILRLLLEYLPEVNDNLLDEVLRRMFKNLSKENPESFPAIIIRYLMLSKSLHDHNTRFEIICLPFLEKIYAFRNEEDWIKRSFFKENFSQIIESLQYNFTFFDTKYQTCLIVIEKLLQWIQSFLPKEDYFKWYVKIHATMLYYKAVRQSIKQNHEIFSDSSRKMSEGVDIVGCLFGRYIVQEVAELKLKYFDSIVDLYSKAFAEYLDNTFRNGTSKSMFITAIIKGMLTQNVGCETRLVIFVLKDHRHKLEIDVYEKIKILFEKKDQISQFFIDSYL